MTPSILRLDLATACYFMAVPETIGATEDEVQGYMERGPVPTDRQQAIFFNLSVAANRLLVAIPMGRC